jgi:hypothetical protein
MASTRNRSSLVIAVVVALMALPMAAHSALVNPITTSDGSVIGGGSWETGVSLGWSVADAGDNYLYSYTFQAPDPGLSHFILQTSGNFTSNNILEISNDPVVLGTFSSEDQGNSNPGMPGDMYGIKFEGIEGDAPWTLTLLSDRAPMEGDFYAKGGDDSYAYNSGFGGWEGAKILVPDTVTQQVPEAGALLLFGSGLFGLVGYRRVHRMK